MSVTHKSGGDGRITVGGGVIYVSSWKLKVSKTLEDDTDTSNFDPATGNTWQSQLPVRRNAEGTVEGFWPFDGTTTLADALYSNQALQAAFMFDRATTFASGKFDFEDVEVETPSVGVIKFSASVKSRGTVTMGS